jgi:hypothetical protein
MDGYLSKKPDNFVDDPERLDRLRRREAQQAKKLDFIDSKLEDDGSSESPKKSPFNMDGVTQDQMRARLFPFSLLGEALQWFYSQSVETVQNWDTLMRAFMKEY